MTDNVTAPGAGAVLAFRQQTINGVNVEVAMVKTSDLTVTSATPTVSTTPAYVTGDVVGGLLTFANVVNANVNAPNLGGGNGMLTMAKIDCASSQTFACDLLLFDANPTSSTFTDNALLAVNANDANKVFAVLHIADWTSLGTASVAQLVNQSVPVNLAATTTLYGVLVARAGFTLASTTDLKVVVKVLPN